LNLSCLELNLIEVLEGKLNARSNH